MSFHFSPALRDQERLSGAANESLADVSRLKSDDLTLTLETFRRRYLQRIAAAIVDDVLALERGMLSDPLRRSTLDALIAASPPPSVGGQQTYDGEFEETVALWGQPYVFGADRPRFVGVGVCINPRVILTAAHTVSTKTVTFKRFAAASPRDGIPVIDFEIIENSPFGDLGLLLMASAHDGSVPALATCDDLQSATGWFVICFDSRCHDRRRFNVGIEIHEFHITAFDGLAIPWANGISGFEGGDSGAGLYVEIGGETRLAGILLGPARLTFATDPTHAVRFTRVDKYRDRILNCAHRLCNC